MPPMRSWRQMTVLLALLLASCTRYKPMPLSSSAVEHGLAAPDPKQLQVSARSIKHPLLKPIAFDDRQGLTPDQAAILAVLANPSLRAVRDRARSGRLAASSGGHSSQSTGHLRRAVSLRRGDRWGGDGI